MVVIDKMVKTDVVDEPLNHNYRLDLNRVNTLNQK